MKTLEINPENWVDDKVTIQYDEDNLIVYDMEFKIVNCGTEDDITFYKILSKEHNWDVLFTGDSEGGEFMCEKYGVERYSHTRDKHIAIAQLICNIL